MTTQHPVRKKQPLQTGQARLGVDLQHEAVLDPTLDFASAMQGPCGETATARSVFLTGATGFLGVFLLAELLQKTEATVYCLVRGADPETALNRVQSKLVTNALWNDSYRERIVPVVGNLAQPLLGLSSQTFDQLAEEIDAIYHNGAVVNFLQSYRALKAANVTGTQEIIRLALQHKCKPLHYVSTVFVFEPRQHANGRVCYETDDLGDGNRLLLGYFQSKWVAEKIIDQARARGLPAFIYRPGVLIGDSETGIWDNPDDFLCRAIKGCIQLGAWPVLENSVSLAPVNYVGKAIVHLAQRSTGQGNVFHLVNPHPLAFSQLFEWIESFGYPLERMPLKEWQTRLKTGVTRPQDNALALLLPILAKGHATAEPQTLPDLFEQGHLPQFDARNTLAGLAGSSIHCPPLTSEHIRAYLAYFVQSGHLAAAPRVQV